MSVSAARTGISTAPEPGNRIDLRKLAKLINLRRIHGAKNVNFVILTPHAYTALKKPQKFSAASSSQATSSAAQDLLPNGLHNISHRSGSTLYFSTGHATGHIRKLTAT
ncbi:hypothetical protein [Methanosarcina sp.]|uniref:hypothetical protein n=1 Tax=Methanosarcina sp. TaxID=2213 RepID=UPI003BB750C5